MRILLTNDDGIHAKGLWHLAEALEGLGDLYIVAPDRDMSGVGTAMTLLSVLRVDALTSLVDGAEVLGVQGTPSDCVILATESLFDDPFDLLVSGINPGANIGLDVFSSGTVGAALQGYYRKIPSIAISATYTNGRPVRYDPAKQVGRALASHILTNYPGDPLLLNINLPDGDSHEIDGVELTTLGPKAYVSTVEREEVGRRSHYWIRHHGVSKDEPPEGTDVWAIRRGRISITPINSMFSDQVDLAQITDLGSVVKSTIEDLNNRTINPST